MQKRGIAFASAPPKFLDSDSRFRRDTAGMRAQELFEGLHFLIFFVSVTFILSTVGGMLFFHFLGGGRRWESFEPHNEAKRGGDGLSPLPGAASHRRRPLPPPRPAPATPLGALAEFWRQGAAEAEDEYLRMRRRFIARLFKTRRGGSHAGGGGGGGGGEVEAERQQEEFDFLAYLKRRVGPVAPLEAPATRPRGRLGGSRARTLARPLAAAGRQCARVDSIARVRVRARGRGRRACASHSRAHTHTAPLRELEA